MKKSLAKFKKEIEKLEREQLASRQARMQLNDESEASELEDSDITESEEQSSQR